MQDCFHQQYEHLHEIPWLGWLPSKVDKLFEGHVRLPTSQGNLSVEPISSNPEIFLIRFRPKESTCQAKLLAPVAEVEQVFLGQRIYQLQPVETSPKYLWRIFDSDWEIDESIWWCLRFLPNITELIFWTDVLASIQNLYKRLWGWITRVNRNHSLKWRRRGRDLKSTVDIGNNLWFLTDVTRFWKIAVESTDKSSSSYLPSNIHLLNYTAQWIKSNSSFLFSIRLSASQSTSYLTCWSKLMKDIEPNDSENSKNTSILWSTVLFMDQSPLYKGQFWAKTGTFAETYATTEEAPLF